MIEVGARVMGAIASAFGVQVYGDGGDEREIEVKDERRRNSLAFHISRYTTYDGEDLNVLVVRSYVYAPSSFANMNIFGGVG